RIALGGGRFSRRRWAGPAWALAHFGDQKSSISRTDEESFVSSLTEIVRVSAPPTPGGPPQVAPQIVLSFDVEEHFRIEAAAHVSVSPARQEHYRGRLDYSTRWLLDRLGEAKARATFFVVGQVARHNPGLIRAIHRAGHEVASHSWDHRRV